MAYWVLQDCPKALGTLLETNIGRSSKLLPEDDIYYANPSVFNFYNFLRAHPLIIRQRLAEKSADSKSKGVGVLLSGFSYGTGKTGTNDKTIVVEDEITPVERRLYFTTAHTHFKAGCPALALEVLAKLPKVVESKRENGTEQEAKSPLVTTDTRIHTGNLETESPRKASGFELNESEGSNGSEKDMIDWAQPCTRLDGPIIDIDWSAPISKMEDKPFELKWSDDEEEDTLVEINAENGNKIEVSLKCTSERKTFKK